MRSTSSFFVRARRLHSALAACVAACVASCADGPPPPSDDIEVLGLARSELVVGESLVVHARLPSLDAAAFASPPPVQLVFAGVFTGQDGVKDAVHLTVSALIDGIDAEGRHLLRWNRFGPFRNPFTSRDRPGSFDGTLSAALDSGLGARRAISGTKVNITVGPSLIIEAFQPFNAACGAPALRALAGVPYHLTVRPVGLKATRFVYELNRVNGTDGVTRFSHELGGSPVATDTLGQDEPLLFNPITDDEQSYVSAIRVVAYDEAGQSVETVLPISVHRPIEVNYGGHRDLAERYDPVPISGCIVGSINTEVCYSESREESRQQTVSVTVSTSFATEHGTSVQRDWQQGISEGMSTSRSEGGSTSDAETVGEGYNVDYEQSESNEVGVATTDGETWDWSMSESDSVETYVSEMEEIYGSGTWSGTVGVSGSGSVPGFAKVTGKVETTVGVEAGGSASTQEGVSRTGSSGRGFRAGGSTDTTRSFGSTTTDSRSESLSGHFALTTQRSSNFQDTQSRNESRVWSMGEGEAVSDSESEAFTQSEEQTWSHSTSLETSQSICGLIPRTQGGLFYRQTTRWVRRAEVRAYDLCGVATHLGELQFNEWTWAANLAIGESCAQNPVSDFPAVACLVPPCGG